MERDESAQKALNSIYPPGPDRAIATYGFTRGWDARGVHDGTTDNCADKLRDKIRDVVKSLRNAAGISKDERWLERASAYEQAAEWVSELIGK
jgi:hypothetical protein